MEDNIWYYEIDGQRQGPVCEVDLIQLTKSRRITYGNLVWKKGLPAWRRIEDTDLRNQLEEVAPPPLNGEYVNNSIVWILAFAPLIGLFLEYVVAGAMYGGDTLEADHAVESGKYWLISVVLNVVLCYFDEKRLKEAGHNTDKFSGWLWLVPVYLFQRAKYLKQNLAYFAVWIVCFAVMLAN